MSGDGTPLSNKGIVITRPAAQASHLAKLVRAAGGSPILFPSIEIVPLENPAPLIDLLSRLSQFDLAIFVSANAVTYSLPLLQNRWPRNAKVAAIGEATHRVLRQQGFNEAIAPATGADSEHLLELSELNAVAGKRVVIFRGQGGRELLKDTLTQRGAVVEYAECYRREIPKLDAAPLVELWSKNQLHAIVVTSGEALRNFSNMLPSEARRRLRETALFVPHPRIAEAAKALGCAEVITTDAGDEGIVRGLVSWFGTKI
jgi:uroporphyrinogen-III synthase